MKFQRQPNQRVVFCQKQASYYHKMIHTIN